MLTVAVAQPACIPLDVTANAAAHAELILRASARLVVFPELSLTGYELDAESIDPGDAILAPIVEACGRTGATALVGAPVGDGTSRHIATLAIDASGARVAYAKTFLGGEEPDLFTPGPGPTAFEIDGWRVGLGICKDTRVPEHIEGTLALGIDLYAAGLVHHLHELEEQDARAARIWAAGRIPVAFASAAGNTGREYPDAIGHSCVWDREGNAVARVDATPGQFAVATLHR